jgi:hypothetical protein
VRSVVGLSSIQSELGRPVYGDTDRRDLLGEGVDVSSTISTLGWEGDFLNRERMEGGIGSVVC